jgi:hypothetical protein
MSCKKCGNSNTNCGCKDTAYTTVKTYTCPPDTACPAPLKCSEFFDAACVYMTDGIADAGILPGSSLESIIQQLIMLVTNPSCVDAPGGVPGGGTVTFIDAIWPGDAITIAGGPIQNSGTFIFNGNGNSNQYIDGQGNLQTFPAISSPVEFQTNGTPNGSQTLLNIVAGTGVTLTESNGAVTIDVDSNIYTADNGLIADPADANNFQLGAAAAPGAPLIRDTYIAGAQFRFEINNANSMFLQGNRVDIEGGGAGAKVLSTGGASENSVEVTGTQVAIESVGAGSTRIFLDPTMIRVQTPLFNTKNDNDVLTLIDAATGEVEFGPVAGALFQTDGVDNADQTLLNLVPGNGITLTNTGGDVLIDGPLFQTDNFDNSRQDLLNLVAGTGITLTESNGSVTIDAAAPAINLDTLGTGGAATYNPGTGDLNIPIYQSQIDVQDEGTSRVVNPTILNFVGAGVTVTNSGSEAIVTIPGGGSGTVNANNGLIYNQTDPANPVVQLGGPDTAPAPLIRHTYINTTAVSEYDFDISGSRATKPIINVSNTGQGTAVKGTAAGGYAIYGVTASGFSGYFEADSSLIGLYSVSKTGNLSAEFESVSSVNNTVIPVVRVMRTVNITNPGVNGANGIGAAVDFFLEDNTNVAAQAGALSYEFTSAATGAVVSKFAVTTANSSTVSRKLEITGAGQLILNNYTTATSFDPDSGASVGVLNVDNTGKVFVGAGGGGSSLAVEVDGTPLSSSTLLNFVPSADITIQDLGGGEVSFVLNNPPATYDANEGVYKNTAPANDTFQLGSDTEGPSTITVPRYIVTGIDGTLNITGTFTGPTSKGIIHVQNNSTAAGIGGQCSISGWSTGRGVYGYSNGSYPFSTGVIGTADNGYGVYAQSTNGYALRAVSTNSTALWAQRASLAAQDSSVVEMAYYYRTASSGFTGVGGGMKFVYDIGGSTNAINAHEIVHKWTNVTNGTQKSQYEIWGTNANTLQQQFVILGGGTAGPVGAWTLAAGQIKFNRYAAGAIYKSAADLSANSGFNLGIDADGNIWATDFEAGTGGTGVGSISIGVLSNGANATVNNPSGPSATIDITGQNAYTQIQADSGTAQNASVFNEAFKITGAQGITTSIDSPGSLDTVTINGPAKYFTVQTQTSAGAAVATYTPAAWNSQLKIKAGAGISITDGGAGLDTIIIASTGGGPTGGTVTNVSGTNANGFTFNITNPDTTPNITLGTNLTGILVGNGTGMTAIAPPTGSGVLTYNSTTNTYSYTTLPTVNNGAIVVGATAALATGLTVALQNSAGGAFTANKADDSTYRVSVGPALTDYATKMSPALPGGSFPQYLTKTAPDVVTLATPVTTFSPGTTGFTISNGVATNVTTPLTGPVILGGVLGVTSGGTGTTTAPGSGQLLVGDGNGGFTVTNITSGGGGINVTSGPGGIVISSTGVQANVKNGLYVNTDGSIRLGSGPNNINGTVQFPDSMLIEQTIIRMNSQNYRLSDGQDQPIQDLGFDINDAASVKTAYLGTSTEGYWFSASTATAAAPASAFQGFIWGGQTTNVFPTNMGGFFHRATGAAAFPTNFAGFANDVPNSRLVMGYLGTSVYEVINRTNNIINHHGLWGGTGGTADFLMYQANATGKLIAFGDVSLLSGGTRFRINDNTQRYDFNTGTIHAAGYGGPTPVPIDAGQIARYILGTSSSGKFYEIDAKAYSTIASSSGTAIAPTLGSTLTVVGAGGITTSISGQTLTITGSGAGSPFPYWSTLSFTASGTGTISGPATIVPDVVGANTLNITAGDNISIVTVDGTTNRFSISAVVPTAGVSIGTVNLTSTGTGTVTGQTSIVANTASGTLGLVAGNGITFVGNATADTITIGTTLGFTQIVGGSNGTVSVTVNNTTGVATITGPNIWNTIAVPTPGGTLGPQSNLSPEIGLDTLSFIAGPGITIATDAASDSLTISSLAAPTNAWFTIAAGNQTITPDVAQDTLTFVGGTGIGVTVSDTLLNPDRVTITNNGVTSIVSGGNTLAGALTLVGTGGTTITSAGSTITINSAGGTSANAFGTIALAGGVNVVADTTSDTLSMIAGAGISISGNTVADSLTFTNTGVTSVTVGGTALTGGLTLVGAGGTSVSATGNTITITGGGGGSANAWYNIAVANGSAEGGTTSLIPDAVQDTLTFAGGTGINISTLDTGGTLDRVVIRNTGVTSVAINDDIPLTGAVTLQQGTNVTLSRVGNIITISALGGGGGGTVNAANQGVSLTGTEVRLGGNSLGAVPFTSTRFIGTGTHTLQVDGTPAIGNTNMQITSSTVGRALRVINTLGAAPEGALFAQAGNDSSPDTNPNGVIYAVNTAKGHAIAAKSADGVADAQAAIFGWGRQGVKGYTQIADGIGVFGESLNSTLGTGVRGIAQGQVVTNPTSNNSYAGWFSINPVNNATRAEVLRLDRTTSNGAGTGSGDFGGTIGYYLENSASNLVRAGQIGYTWAKAILVDTTGDSRFKVSVLKTSTPAVDETVRLELRETGQLLLSSYAGINRVFPAPTIPAEFDKGPFLQVAGTQDVPVNTNYETGTVYDYLVLGSACYFAEGESAGRVDTIRNTQGKYSPVITASGGGTPVTGTSPSIRSAVFTRFGNVVQGMIRMQCGPILGAVAAGSFDIILPVFADSNFADVNDVLGTATSRLNVSGSGAAANGRFDNISVGAVVGSPNRLRFSFAVTTAQQAGITNEFTIQFMYNLY